MTTMPIARLAPARSSQVRLTRRGRFVIFTLAVVAVLAIGLVLASGSVATDEREPTQVVQVSPGDTLWAIASDLADDGGVRAMIDRSERLNALESGMLVAGQRLVVPAD
jgi:hypothetical protein